MLIALFEGVQYFMPRRHCDPADIIAGALGIGIACLLSFALQRWLWSSAGSETRAKHAAASDRVG
jgi:hypothetical protein